MQDRDLLSVIVKVYSRLLEDHDSVTKRAIGEATPHCPEGLKEGYAIAPLGKGKGPQSWRLDQRPGDVPRTRQHEAMAALKEVLPCL